MNSDLSEEFEVKVGKHQGTVLSPFLQLWQMLSDLAREGVLSELLHAGDLVLMRETIKGLRNNLLKWKEAF